MFTFSRSCLVAIFFTLFAAAAVGQQVENPGLSLPGGDYVVNQTLVVTCPTAGATIHYTTANSMAELLEPTESDPVISSGGSIPLERQRSLGFKAFKAGMTPSEWIADDFRVTGQLAAGGNHTVALRSNGEVWAWGSNNNGELGDGTSGATPRPTPSRVRTDAANFLSGIRAVAAGTSHTVALKADGTVVAWGLNSSGQLGDGTVVQKLYPVAVKLANGSSLSGITQIACGATHTLALKNDGTVWAWGANASGQIGDGTTTSPKSFATQVKVSASVFLTNVVSIAAGSAHSAVAKADGTVWTWGLNGSGQLGNGTIKSASFPVQAVSGSGALTSVTRVFCGASSTYALDGGIWACGLNGNGQLGDGTTTSPRKVAVRTVYPAAPPFQPNPYPVSGVTLGASGASHTEIMISGNGGNGYYSYLQSFGLNTSGQLGNGNTTQQVYPVAVQMNTTPPPAGAIAAGTNHTVAAFIDGSVWSWGANTAGQLAQDNTSANYIAATKTNFIIVEALDDSDADGLPNWRERELGTNPYAPDTDGDQLADAWELQYGFNPLVADPPGDPDGDGFTNAQESQNGTNPYDYYNGGTVVFAPNGGWFATEQSVLLSFVTPSATLFYTKNGITPTASDRSTTPGSTLLIDRPLTLEANALKAGLAPTATTTANFTISGKVSGGATHSLALKSDGTIWAWGGNASGQLGIGTSDANSHLVPLQVKQNATTFLTGISFAAAGASHSLAIKQADGSVYGWGSDSAGQLGDNSTATQQAYPVQAKTTATGNPILTGIVDIAGGLAHSIALKSDGTVWTWGSNSAGQLGDGSTTTRKLAGQVKTGTSTFLTGVVAIGAGDNFCAALKSDGTVWTWGANASGQLGIGSTTAKSFATQVTAVGSITDIACGAAHMLALQSNNDSGLSWGSNTNGQLGTGNTTQATSPVTVQYSSWPWGTTARAIAAGGSHSAILRSDGSVYTFGLNSSGQLSIGSTTQQTYAVRARSSTGEYLVGIVDIACGANHTLATKGDGSASVSGLNSSGQTASSPTTVNPTACAPVSNFLIITAFADPDGDGVLTWQEREAGTNPSNPDTDTDQMPDGWEIAHGLNPLLNDASADPDGDGLTNLQEFMGNTDPGNYYNNQPFILSVTCGDGQRVSAGEWVPQGLQIRVTNPGGVPLANAPVTFSIIAAGSGLSATYGGSTIASLSLRTDSSGFAVAYYRTPAAQQISRVRVQATSGATVTEVRFSASTMTENFPSAGLQLWLRGDAGVTTDANNGASQWADGSGNSFNAIQNYPSYAPLFVPNAASGKPVLRFDGVNKVLDLPNFMSGKTAGEMFVVMRTSATQPDWPGFMTIGTGGEPWSGGSAYPSQYGTITDDFGSSTMHGTPRPVQDLTQLHIYDAVSTATEWTDRINGLLHFTTATNTVSFSTGPRIGYGYGAVTSGFFAGDFGEILIFDRALSSADRKTVEAYLSSKYPDVATIPGTPAQPRAVRLSTTQVSLNWRYTLGSVTTQFHIERKEVPGQTWTEIATVDNASGYFDSTVLEGHSYAYRVRATNYRGVSPYSAEAPELNQSVSRTSVPFTGLSLWLKADSVNANSYVARWSDQSGRAQDAVTLDGNARPLFVQDPVTGTPVLRFDGASKVLNLPNFMSGKTAGEMFVVLRTSAMQPDWPGFMTIGTGGYPWDNGSAYPTQGGTVRDDFGSNRQHDIGRPNQDLTHFHIHNVVSTANEWTARTNGTLDYSTTTNTVSFTASPQLGYGAGAVVAGFFAGDFAEILVFDHALLPAERDRVHWYLAEKFAVESYDLDQDGLTNVEEQAFGTDPLNPDTNGDGISDGASIRLGIDPLGTGYPWAPSPQPPANTPLNFTLSDPPGAVLLP